MVSHPSAPVVSADAVLDAIGDAVVWADAEGVIQRWNPAAERLFGHPAADAVGRSLDVIIPERLRARHWEGWNRAVGSGTSRYGPGELLAVPAEHADGRQLSIEFTVGFTWAADGSVSGVVAVLRDASARRAADKELRERLARAEAAAAGAADAGTVDPLRPPGS